MTPLHTQYIFFLSLIRNCKLHYFYLLLSISIAVFTFNAFCQVDASLSPNAQLGVSQVLADDDNWRIWARRNDGQLVTVQRKGGPSWTWSLWDTGGVGVHSNGVAATWWYDEHARTAEEYIHEHAFFIGDDGLLHEVHINNGIYTWSIVSAPPGGAQFTGHLSALTVRDTSYPLDVVHLFVITSQVDNGLVVFYREVTDPADPWVIFANWSDASPLKPIASTKTLKHSELASIRSAFYVDLDNDVQLLRFTGDRLRKRSIGNPEGGLDICESMSVSDEYLYDDGIGTTIYRIELLCTVSYFTTNYVYSAYATLPKSTRFTWNTHYFAHPIMDIKSGPYTLSSIDSPHKFNPYARILDFYLLDEWDQIIMFSRLHDYYFPTIIGIIRETNYLSGGSAAIRTWDYYSRNIVAGHLGFLADGVHYLYSRAGATVTPDYPEPYIEALQVGAPINEISGLGEPHAESFMAESKGRIIAASMVRPGLGDVDDWPYIQAAWSGTDGHTWGPQTTLNTNGMQYIADPTAAMNSEGKAYVTMVGVNFADGECRPGAVKSDSVIYFVTSSNGSPFSPPIEVARSSTGLLDHPWMGIDERTTFTRLHFVWYNQPEGVVEYTYIDDYNDDYVYGPISVITDPDRGGPPTLDVVVDGSVYIVWKNSYTHYANLCKLDPITGKCESDFIESMEGDYHYDGNAIIIPGPWPQNNIHVLQGWSIKASKNHINRLYYAYQKKEDTSTAKDVYLTVGTYHPSGPYWSWSTPEPASNVNDGADQFFPTVSVNYDYGEQELVHVSWYDRYDTETECGGVINKCITTMMNTAIHETFPDGSSLTTFYGQNEIQKGDATDPELLPRHCLHEDRRFIGDYHDGYGDLLHSHFNWSSAPIGSPVPTSILESSFISAAYFTY